MLFSFKNLEVKCLDFIYSKNKSGYVRMREYLHSHEPSFIEGCQSIMNKFPTARKIIKGLEK